jgi:uncharacterized protein (DUF1800 family)
VKNWLLRSRRCLAASLLCAGLLACGGGKPTPDAAVTLEKPQGQSQLWLTQTPGTDAEASRFLTQATFGPTSADTALLKTIGFGHWVDQQLQLPHQTRNQALMAQMDALSNGKSQFTYAFWTKVNQAPDQLRQRMAYALSQIFVVSFADGCSVNRDVGMASYYDMLTENALGNFADLLEAVTLHPMMGCYLSHLRNQKADLTTGRVPDENYAREVMQLFSIGLVRLNMDGTPTNASSPVEAYTPTDVSNLARVFTGFSWDCPDHKTTPEVCFKYGDTKRSNSFDPWTVPMRAYADFHDSGAKVVLGQTIAANMEPRAELRKVVELLATHPNTAPFISKQLIQRFVTSNPSPAYVARVAEVFKATKGNLGQTLAAVLLSPEARDTAYAASDTFGKVREPVLRLSALFRAMQAQSTSGFFLLGPTQEASIALNQSPLYAPNVFNFYRPGYVPPGSATANANAVAPELQLTHETSMAGYVTFLRNVIAMGVGAHGLSNETSKPDIQFPFNTDTTTPLLALADQPSKLLSELNFKMAYGMLSSGTQEDIIKALLIDFSYPANVTHTQLNDLRRARVWSALLLVMASPEFLIQK